MLSALGASTGLALLMVMPGFAQTTTYDGSAANPNPAPGTTIDNGSGDSVFFRRATAQPNAVGNAGDATITNHNGGVTRFLDDSSANTATINNSSDGVTSFDNDATAGHATINNGPDGSIVFVERSTAGNASINNLSGGASTIFADGATAGDTGAGPVGGATITNRGGGTTLFTEGSTAGRAVITNGQNGTSSFADQSTADHSLIINDQGTTTFSGRSGAGTSTISNRNGGSTEFSENSSANIAAIDNNNGQTSFKGDSTAGSAHIANFDNGSTTFSDRSSAGAAIINADGGGAFNNKTGIFFKGTSTAGSAGINVSNGGVAAFDNNSTAAAATISADQSVVSFAGTSTAGSATINVKNNGAVSFFENSTATNATINLSNRATAGFNANSTAGNATINNNGEVVGFTGNSTAGNARLINGDGNRRFDFSGTTGAAGDGKISAGSIAGGGTFFLGGNQLTVGSNGDSTTVSGVIADGGVKGGSGGSLVKTGSGTLTLSGANIYSGGTELHGGVLSVSADTNLGAASGRLVFSGGTLATTASFATVRDVSFQQSGTFDVAGGTVLGLTGVITGAGSFVKAGAGALLYDGNGAGFTDNTNIISGALVVGSGADHGDAVLGGSFNVASGGMLAGHGTVGAGAGSVVTIAAGGILSPGNSIGKLTVNGDLAMAAGSHLVAEINASGASDRVNVLGTGDITGAVLDVSAQGAKIGRYAIVTTAGGLAGTFGSVTGIGPISAFVGITDSYDTNNAYLNVLRVRDFADAGLTRNQKSAAGGIQSLPGGTPVYDAILYLPTDANARHAFDQVSGEVHASAKTALIEDSGFLRNAVNERIRAAFDGVGTVGGSVVTYENGRPQSAPSNTGGIALWGQGFGSWGHGGNDGNAARLNRSSGGFFTGLDATVFDTWRLGVVAGYSNTSFNVKERASSGASDNYHLGLYGGTVWGDFAFRAGAAYTWHDITTNRSVAFPGFADNLKGHYRAATAQVFGELAYSFNAGIGRFEPYVNLAYANLSTEGFSERGGAAALTSATSNADATFTTLGLRASTVFDLGGANLTAKGLFGWRHVLGEAAPASIQRFAAGGSAFTIWGVSIARDAAVIEAGLDYAVAPNATLGVLYNAQFGSNLADQGIKANFNIKF